MNIVVTGATSFLGSNIIKKLMQNEDNRIWAVVRPNSKNRSNIPQKKNVKIVEVDMEEIEILYEKVDESIDIFYHLAWEGVRAPQRDDEKIQQANYRASVKTIQVCQKLGAKRFIGAGSQAEYGKMNGEITENYPCTPLTEYGKEKYKTYQYISNYAKEHGIEFIWTRIFSIYGIGDYKGSLIMNCIEKMQRNESIELTECVQEWDYLYIDEAAEIFAKMAYESELQGVYNVASGVHKPLKEFIEIIKKQLNSESVLEFGKVPYPETGMVSFIPSILKLKNDLLWSSQITFEEGIKLILKG